MSEQKLVVVYRAAGELEAYVIKGKLTSAGIPAALQNESLGTMAFTVDGLGEFRVVVPAGWEGEARAILAEPPGANLEP